MPMPYRRGPSRARKYPHSNAPLKANESINSGLLVEANRIPLPNEKETASIRHMERRVGRKGLKGNDAFSFIETFIKRIKIDDIILIGLIILLLDEQIEDDFLIILLLFLLLG